MLPTLWFRNTWSWGPDERPKPALRRARPTGRGIARRARRPRHALALLRRRRARCCSPSNETNNERLVRHAERTHPYVKDGIDRVVVHGEADAVNPERVGTKAAVHYVLDVPAGGSATVRLRLRPTPDLRRRTRSRPTSTR